MGAEGQAGKLLTPLPTFRAVPKGAKEALGDLFADLGDELGAWPAGSDEEAHLWTGLLLLSRWLLFVTRKVRTGHPRRGRCRILVVIAISRRRDLPKYIPMQPCKYLFSLLFRNSPRTEMITEFVQSLILGEPYIR